MSLTLRAPATPEEHAALRSLCERVAPKAKGAVAVLRRSYRLDARTPWRGWIYEGPAGPEAVIVIDVRLDPTASFIIADEKRAARELREWMIHYGFYVGGDPHQPSHVWVRSAPI